jgi:signal transduction histidine kinase
VEADNQEYNWEQARALAAIHEAGREIAASLDLDRTLRLVMQKAAETLPMDAGILFVRDESTQRYRVAVSHNLPADRINSITFGFDEGVPGWVVQYQQPLIVHDARTDARVHPMVVAADVLSVLAVPLICREQLVGVLNLFCQSGTHAFDEAALQLAQVFADQAAVFLENARLVGELRQSAAELEQRVEERTRQVREKQAQVIQAEKMAAVGRLAASVAHEINNPLQAIALHLGLATEETLSTQSRWHLDVVGQEFDRITGIVGRLLDFQRPQAGEMRPVNILHTLASVAVLARKQLEKTGIEIVQCPPAELPPVAVVENQLKQVFLNLILNAADVMPDGGTLTISATVDRDEVRLDFTDTGPGLEPDAAARLFEPFFTTKPNGTGLGLAVSHEIVANHGGTLTVANRPAGGAVFTVALPVCDVVMLRREDER